MTLSTLGHRANIIISLLTFASLPVVSVQVETCLSIHETRAKERLLGM